MGARTSDEPIKSADEDNSPNLPSGGWEKKLRGIFAAPTAAGATFSDWRHPPGRNVISDVNGVECKTRNQFTGAIVLSGDEWQRCHDRCNMGPDGLSGVRCEDRCGMGTHVSLFL